MNINALRWELTKARFADRPVRDESDRQARVVMVRFGSFTRRDARRNLRRQGRPGVYSRPGEPPRNRTGALRDWILFEYDEREKSVIVGPYKLNVVYFNGDGRPVKGTVPSVLEHGGDVGVLEWKVRVPRAGGGFDERWQRADLRSRRRIAERETRVRKAHIEPRPYMAPAFDKNLIHLQRWRRAA